jgi:hypothetical protein
VSRGKDYVVQHVAAKVVVKTIVHLLLLLLLLFKGRPMMEYE